MLLIKRTNEAWPFWNLVPRGKDKFKSRVPVSWRLFYLIWLESFKTYVIYRKQWMNNRPTGDDNDLFIEAQTVQNLVTIIIKESLKFPSRDKPRHIAPISFSCIAPIELGLFVIFSQPFSVQESAIWFPKKYSKAAMDVHLEVRLLQISCLHIEILNTSGIWTN